MSWKRRALRTFIQSFIGILVANMVPFTSFVFADGISKDSVIRAVIVQLLVPAISAGCAALMNMNAEGADGDEQ